MTNEELEGRRPPHGAQGADETKSDAFPGAASLAAPLLVWFDANKRVLPFRTQRTPYRVWVSEIMLQQTRMSAAVPYFERFMRALPTVADLAACPPQQLDKLWEGLGYYSRARNLQKAARIVTEQYGGALPADYAQLKALPGIGEYTAGAVASIGFGLREVAVDGNVLRVFSRLLADGGNVLHPDTKQRLAAAVRAAQDARRPGDFNEALMELGALVCVPNGPPLCGECPLRTQCRACLAGTQEQYPVKTPLKARRQLFYTVVLAVCGGRVYLEQRPETGLLAGLWQPLMLEGTLGAREAEAALAARGFLPAGPLQPLPGAKHIFTHLEWHMTGWAAPCAAAVPGASDTCVWASRADVETLYALPGAFKAYKKELKRLL